ncbi:MAG: two-component system LytT family sensor kinase [Saprospiraceae bacterium]|jgi:two-component system LytT family sensor kinase
MNLALIKKRSKIIVESAKSKDDMESPVLEKSEPIIAAQSTASQIDKKQKSKKTEVAKQVFADSSLGYVNITTLPTSHHQDMAEIQILLENYKLSNTYYWEYQKTVNETEKRVVSYKVAQNLYAGKQYEEAIVAYKQLLETETNTSKIALCNSRIAGSKISLGDTEEGLSLYQNSIYNTTFSSNPQEGERQEYIEFSKNKEVVTKALREQNKFEEEANLRLNSATLARDNIEFLKIAQSYYQVGKIADTEQALDNYLKDVSYQVIDVEEIKVIKQMSVELGNSGNTKKAYQYLNQYEEISDSIKIRVKEITGSKSRIGALGVQNVVELKILQKDKEISNNMITHLMHEQDLQEDLVGFQKTIIYLLSFLIFVGLGTTIYIVRVSKQRRIANQQLAIRSLRSQMNPHFIFNALNSVNSFISMNDERSANKFLTEFSTLMRSVMENSEYDFIPLAKELEIIELYLGLEHYRFKDKFTYKLKIDPDLDEDEMMLPPMLIQPYIENSIWHGLRYKDTVGELLVSFEKQKNNLVVTIQDDGIGRKKSQELKTKNQKKNKSTAIKNIDQRIKLISALHHIDVKVNMEDLHEDGSGTKITLNIPQVIHHN